MPNFNTAVLHTYLWCGVFTEKDLQRDQIWAHRCTVKNRTDWETLFDNFKNEIEKGEPNTSPESGGLSREKKEALSVDLRELLCCLPTKIYLEVICKLDNDATRSRPLPNSDIKPIDDKIDFDSHFILVNRLGSGGNGIVYEAIDLRLHNKVAIKFFCPGKNGSGLSEAAFISEVQNQSKVNSQGVVAPSRLERLAKCPTGLDAADAELVSDGSLFSVMNLIEDGLTLDNYLTNETSWEVRVSLIRQVLLAMQIVHNKEIVHMDLKPTNILVDGQGSCFLADFLSPVGDAACTLTHAPPEQIRFGTMIPTKKVDVFALGTIVYEVLTNRPLFEKIDRDQAIDERICRRGLRNSLNSLSKFISVENLEAILERCLALDPIGRYKDAGELKKDFDLLVGNFPLAKPRRDFQWMEIVSLFRRREPQLFASIAMIAGLCCTVLIGAILFAGWMNDFNRQLEVKNSELEELTAEMKSQIDLVVERDIQKFQVALTNALNNSSNPYQVWAYLNVDTSFGDENQVYVKDELFSGIERRFAAFPYEGLEASWKLPFRDAITKSSEKTIYIRTVAIDQMYSVLLLVRYLELSKQGKMEQAFAELEELKKIRVRYPKPGEERYPKPGEWRQVWYASDRVEACTMVTALKSIEDNWKEKWLDSFLNVCARLHEPHRDMIFGMLCEELVLSKSTYRSKILSSIARLVPQSDSIANMNSRLLYGACLAKEFECRSSREQYQMVLDKTEKPLYGTEDDKAKFLETLTKTLIETKFWLRDEDLHKRLEARKFGMVEQWKEAVEWRWNEYEKLHRNEMDRNAAVLDRLRSLADKSIPPNERVSRIRMLLDEEQPFLLMKGVQLIANEPSSFRVEVLKEAQEILNEGLKLGFVGGNEFDELDSKLRSELITR